MSVYEHICVPLLRVACPLTKFPCRLDVYVIVTYSHPYDALRLLKALEECFVQPYCVPDLAHPLLCDTLSQAMILLTATTSASSTESGMSACVFAE
jgi:hypothetical protein